MVLLILYYNLKYIYSLNYEIGKIIVFKKNIGSNSSREEATSACAVGRLNREFSRRKSLVIVASEQVRVSLRL